jgi:hypothetical protein
VISDPVSIRQDLQILGNPGRTIVKRPADVPEIAFRAWRRPLDKVAIVASHRKKLAN